MVMPGDNITMEVELEEPVALETGLGFFAIREGGQTLALELLPRSLNKPILVIQRHVWRYAGKCPENERSN